ncbi:MULTISPECIES: histidine phosphatase family protein [unclassified Methylibium]|uniref:histidine phosphatase family protein n=1 Tax=Methylibium sp. T29 TaxID=1430884 RepID=UPI001E49DCA5|nr:MULTISPECIES: histidine phosphatase family protein [unclassified Methylibium]
MEPAGKDPGPPGQSVDRRRRRTGASPRQAAERDQVRPVRQQRPGASAGDGCVHRRRDRDGAGAGHAAARAPLRHFPGHDACRGQGDSSEVYRRYSDEDVEFAIPGGESTQACFARSVGCLEELAACRPGQRILVVTHGGVVDGLYRHTKKLPHVGSRVFSMVNGSLNEFLYERGEWHLKSWADVAHLEGTPLDDV